MADEETLDIEVGDWPTISGAHVELYLRPAAERDCGVPLVYTFGPVGPGEPMAAYERRERCLGSIPVDCDADSLRAWLRAHEGEILILAGEYCGAEVNVHGNRIGVWTDNSDDEDGLGLAQALSRAIENGQIALHWSAVDYLCVDDSALLERVCAYGIDKTVTGEVDDAEGQGALLDEADVRSYIESIVASAVEQGTHVWVETMPDHLRGSHRAARNWGEYPHNGAERRLVETEEATDIVENDPDGYAHVVEVAPVAWSLYRAAIDHDGLQLAERPFATARTLREALSLADDPSLHGPEGVALISKAGRVVYTSDEYDAARREAAQS